MSLAKFVSYRECVIDIVQIFNCCSPFAIIFKNGDGVWSEISLIHPDDVHWFLTMDETHHAFTTKGNKGGSTRIRYANTSFPRTGERVVDNAYHTTGVYGFTLGGEPLPPLYILSTSSVNAENYRLDPRVCEGLPMVSAKYGQDELTTHPSMVAIRKKGSMDTGLWHQLCRDCYMKCYKDRIAPEPVRDPATGKLLKGPLIVKTDAGPGRLSREAESIDFREELARIGVFILLSLPNGTACTAELDQMYTRFKDETKNSTIRVAGIKMAARASARRQGKDNEANEDDESSMCSDDNDDDDEPKKQRSICNVNITNHDLSFIVNGYSNDPVELHPFDHCFTKENIIKTWIAVGFLPMTGNAANDPKVAYELGPDGAPVEAQERMNSLVEDYSKSSLTLTSLGFNGDVLDLEPRRVQDVVLPEDEEAAVQQLMKNKGINKAGSLYKAGEIMANSRVVLEAARRTAIQAKQDKDNAAKKKDAKEKQIDSDGVAAFRRWVAQGKQVSENENHRYPILPRKDAVSIMRVLLPRIDVKGELKMKDFSTAKSCIKWLGEIGRGTTWEDEMQVLEDNFDDDELEMSGGV